MSSYIKDELDQLQSGIENVSVHKREKLREFQEELMDIQLKVTKDEKEVTA